MRYFLLLLNDFISLQPLRAAIVPMMLSPLLVHLVIPL